MKDQESKNRFIELRAKGWSYNRIGKELKTSKQTLITWSKEFALQIANLKAIELESLREKYFLLKEQKIEIFGERLKAISQELEGRDLSQIPTRQLIDLFFTFRSILESEAVEPVFQEREDTLETSLRDTWSQVKNWKG